MLELINELKSRRAKRYLIELEIEGMAISLRFTQIRQRLKIARWPANRSMGEALRDAWNWTTSNLS